MYSVRLKHTAVENLISEVTFINHDSLNKSNSEVPISGKQLEIIAVRFGFDKPVVNQYSFSNGPRRYLEEPRLGAVLHTTGHWGRSYLGVGRRTASRT